MYKAFISYSHVDDKWGTWLHTSLEKYKIPEKLIGTSGRDGLVPKRLFPIFRDREELPTATNLGDMLTQALEDSEYLVVICSPHSANSKWVNEEILTYKRLGREDRIFAIITSGEPNAIDKKGYDDSEECFPKALKYKIGEDGNLSSERTEPIAADTRHGKDGKSDSLLKIIAGLLGVSYAVLKDREAIRQKRAKRIKISIAASIIISVLAVLGYQWDHNRIKTAYFSDIKTQFGVPVGLRPISKDEQKAKQSSYKLESRGGQVIAYYRINGLGRFINDADDMDTSKWIIKYDDEKFVQSITRKNSNNQEIQTDEYRFYDLGRTAIVQFKKGEGVTILGNRDTKEDDSAANTKSLNQTMAQHRLIFNKAGYIKEKYFEAIDGTAVPDQTGRIGIRYDYTSNGKVNSETYISRTRGQFLLDTGIAEVRYAYDAQGNVAEVSYFGLGGRTAYYRNGYVKRTYEYDALGNLISVDFFGADDQRINHKNGNAQLKIRRDNRGRSIEERFFDKKGAPTLVAGEYHLLKNTYDETGKEIKYQYFDINEQPIFLSNNGYAQRKELRDGNGNLLKEAYYDLDGNLIALEQGHAGFYQSFDKKGFLIKYSYFGPDEKLVLFNQEFAVNTYLRDEQGKLLETAYFNQKNEPIIVGTYHKAVSRYDNHGRWSETSYYGANNELIMQPSGYAKIIVVFSSGNKLLEKSFYDADDKLIVVRDNYAKITMSYDRFGNTIETATYGDDGELILLDESAAITKRVYDQAGNQLEVSYFGTDAKPILYKTGYGRDGQTGYAKLVQVYDNNNPIMRTTYGIDDNRMLNEYQYAIEKRVYKNKSIHERTFFGANEEPVLHKDGYFHWENNGWVVVDDNLEEAPAYSTYDLLGNKLDGVGPQNKEESEEEIERQLKIQNMSIKGFNRARETFETKLSNDEDVASSSEVLENIYRKLYYLYIEQNNYQAAYESIKLSKKMYLWLLENTLKDNDEFMNQLLDELIEEAAEMKIQLFDEQIEEAAEMMNK